MEENNNVVEQQNAAPVVNPLDEHGKHLKLQAVQQAFDDLTNVWDVMFPVERYKFINEVVKQITVHIDRVEIEYKTDGLEAVITETEAANEKKQLKDWSTAISK